jgi:Nucleotide modification associated domain 1
MSRTETEYKVIVANCQSIFNAKIQDYGTAWRVLRPISIVDQLYIKAQRIRTIQDLGVQKVNDEISGEWKAIINYGIIALIQMELNNDQDWDLPNNQAIQLYQKHFEETFHLMMNKNHDYGEAWRNMSQASFADLILTKILRIKQIIANDGKTNVSEGVDANYRDIVNYAVFALILAK